MIYQQPARELRSIEEATPDRPVFVRRGKDYRQVAVVMVPLPAEPAIVNAWALGLTEGEADAVAEYVSIRGCLRRTKP